MRHAQAGIFPLTNGDGIVKAAPETTVIGFSRIGRGHDEIFQRKNGGCPAAVEERFPMRAVVEKKSLVAAALAKVCAQEGKNPIFRCDLRGQYASDIRKTNEAAILLDLAAELAHGTQEGVVVSSESRWSSGFPSR